MKKQTNLISISQYKSLINGKQKARNKHVLRPYIEPKAEITDNGLKVNIKPLSVNEAWKGERFKTDAYRTYERILLLILPDYKLPSSNQFKIYLEFGVSYIGSDWDNPVKPFQDILQKRYKINDSMIWEANVKKVKVSKGNEYIIFKITEL